MGLFDKIRGEFIDIIEWLDDSRDVMVSRFPRHQNEIKMGAKLVVRETQNAVFVNEGKLADVFPPGTYTLTTQNLPVLSTLLGWKYGFNSPFKAEVYFVNMRRFVDLKWGTANPVMLRDPEFGPVRLRAYGTYTIRVANTETFMKEIVGTDPLFQVEEITEQLRNMIVSKFSDLLAESKIPVLDLAASYDELSRFANDQLSKDFGAYGLDLSKFLVENISLPPQVEQALDRRTEMGVVGDLGRYTQYQAARAMEAAAANPSGGGGEGIGIGMGLAMGQKMAEALAGGAPRGAPPPLPGSAPRYFLGVGGQQVGPLDLNGLRSEIQAGRLTRTTLVWKDGMSGWEPAERVPEVSCLFQPATGGAGGPPPLP
ncbi:MAG: SPFH domain-containing protein [Planctomycetes bacterium]|nr:SPFH domain-containing protein [Planctomycetota bacterium]